MRSLRDNSRIPRAAAVYHLSVKCVCRASGRSAPAAAAYRSGDEIEDRRTGVTHDYTRKGGVVHSEILVPAGAPAWAEDRSALWNEAEAAEKRKDARVAREYEVAIPKELSREQGIQLVRDFAQELCDRYGVAVDFNVHKDSALKWDGSAKGFDGLHAHVMTTTRRLGPEGFGAKAEPELSDAKRKSLGLSDGATEIERVRQVWEVSANRHLERAGESQRIDRRSLKDQGIDREPTRHLGPAATALERRGERTDLGEVNRRILEAFQQGEQERHQAAQLDRQIIDLRSSLADVLRQRARLQFAPPWLGKGGLAKGKPWQADRPVDWMRTAKPLGSLPTLSQIPSLETLPRLNQKVMERASSVDQGRLPSVPASRSVPSAAVGSPALPEQVPEQVVEPRRSQAQLCEVAKSRRGFAQVSEAELGALPMEGQQAVFVYRLACLVQARNAQIARAKAAAAARVERRREVLQRIQAQRPVAPKGLLAAFKRESHERALASWEARHAWAKRLHDQAERLRMSPGLAAGQSDRWAMSQMAKSHPELTKRIMEVLYMQKAEQAKAAAQAKERLRSQTQDRGAGRGNSGPDRGRER